MSSNREHEEEYRKERWPWMTNDQFECYIMLCDLCRGSHHIGGKVKPCGDSGIMINLTFGFHASTFDFSGLTEAVIMAHDRCIRFQIEPSGPRMLKLFFHKREREGSMSQRHPTLEQAIEKLR